MKALRRPLRLMAVLPLFALLGGCDMVLLNPAGDIAVRERDLMIASTVLMLLIIIPVMIATVVFAWRYRASNATAPYDPDWSHSTQLEVWIWTAPLLIVVALGAITWMGTHLLDPFRLVDRLDAKRPVASGVTPLRIDVVALDWKWLFFYPQQGIATVNDLSVPVDVPIDFHITSATVMNAFFVPALAGQIYAMAGMETKLAAVANQPGEFTGMSSQYSGAGFSHMNFQTHSLSQQDFDQWVAKAKSQSAKLDQPTYAQLEKPSEDVPKTYFASFDPNLFKAILNMCSSPGKMCQDEMMHIDSMGGGGKESEANYHRLFDSGIPADTEAPGATFPGSGRPPDSLTIEPEGMKPREGAPIVNHGGWEHGHKGAAANDFPAPPQLNQR